MFGIRIIHDRGDADGYPTSCGIEAARDVCMLNSPCNTVEVRGVTDDIDSSRQSEEMAETAGVKRTTQSVAVIIEMLREKGRETLCEAGFTSPRQRDIS